MTPLKRHNKNMGDVKTSNPDVPIEDAGFLSQGLR
jgi:hypothetical protein